MMTLRSRRKVVTTNIKKVMTTKVKMEKSHPLKKVMTVNIKKKKNLMLLRKSQSLKLPFLVHPRYELKESP